jgi:hypothetical protein
MDSIKILALITLITLFGFNAHSQEMATYWSKQHGYGITYPSSWKYSHDADYFGDDVFDFTNPAGDISFNVITQVSNDPNKNHYKSITDVPNVIERTISDLRKQIDLLNIQSGKTTLSNNAAIWIKANFVHRAMSQEIWFTLYQVITLRKNRTYIITTKIAAPTLSAAESKFQQNRSLIFRILASFSSSDMPN